MSRPTEPRSFISQLHHLRPHKGWALPDAPRLREGGVCEHRGLAKPLPEKRHQRCSQDCANAEGKSVQRLRGQGCQASWLRGRGRFLWGWTGYSTKSSGSQRAEQELALPACSSSSDLSARAQQAGPAPQKSFLGALGRGSGTICRPA